MAARILETNPAPFGKADVDPVTLDIIENALRNARVEMDATLFRTAGSPLPRFQPLAGPLARIQSELKRQFDPAGILNPGRLYPEF